MPITIATVGLSSIDALAAVADALAAAAASLARSGREGSNRRGGSRLGPRVRGGHHGGGDGTDRERGDAARDLDRARLVGASRNDAESAETDSVVQFSRKKKNANHSRSAETSSS